MAVVDIKANALQCYQKCMEIKLHPGSPARLSIAVSYSIFASDVQKQIGEGVKIAEKALNEAQDKIEEMQDEDFKESKLLVDTLKENVSMWNQQMEEIKKT
mmetsp:Transcript_4297/g.7253  ORF Transcript_4297/g.7253 Transcript_4297/m.7253 type:complete len:101 (-) Transcript_4297:48-350(-)